jgi:hypothetical protein
LLPANNLAAFSFWQTNSSRIWQGKYQPLRRGWPFRHWNFPWLSRWMGVVWINDGAIKFYWMINKCWGGGSWMKHICPLSVFTREECKPKIKNALGQLCYSSGWWVGGVPLWLDQSDEKIRLLRACANMHALPLHACMKFFFLSFLLFL